MSSTPISNEPHGLDTPTHLPQTDTHKSAASSSVQSSAMDSKAVKSTMDTVQNHPITQNVTNGEYPGPVAQNVKAEGLKTRDEFSDLASSRQTPAEPAATGQPLTHYHSLFYRLLSWKNPRATAITYAGVVAFIFAARYLNIIRYILKGSWVVFGITASAELVGKLVLGNGFTSQIRPKKYFVVPRDSLERFTEDLEQLINFFVIEFQRVVFAENVYVTVGAFLSTLITYYLVKFVPLWGLSLIGTTIIYFAPLIYLKNKEVIDAQLDHTANVIKSQSNQLRDASAQSLSRATETARSYAGEYGKQASELLGTARAKTAQTYNQASSFAAEKTGQVKQRTASTSKAVDHSDFPTAPKEEPLGSAKAPEPVPAQHAI